MNGRDLTLGVVGALAVAGALAGRRGSRSEGSYRSFTHGKLTALPSGAVLEAEDGTRFVHLSGEWFLQLPVEGQPVETRSIIGKLRIVSEDERSLWPLLVKYAAPRVSLDNAVEVTIVVPREVRAFLQPSIAAETTESFSKRVLEALTRRYPSLPAVRPVAVEIGDYDGFIRATFAPIA